ncbi:MAG: DNA-3-methyladenine glycosylase [Fimbriimonadales bacterium]
MNATPLPQAFYARSTLLVARALLGHWLVVHHPEGWVGGRIVETEAYLPDDPASHSYRGQTERNRSMFGAPGTAYVYLIYGVHWCFNIACEAEGIGAAVLIRALEPTLGIEWMERHRGHRPRTQLCRGPGNLCRALGITRAMDGEQVFNGKVQVWAGEPILDSCVGTSPRIGITQGREHPWRFYVRGNPCVSGRWR